MASARKRKSTYLHRSPIAPQTNRLQYPAVITISVTAAATATIATIVPYYLLKRSTAIIMTVFALATTRVSCFAKLDKIYIFSLSAKSKSNSALAFNAFLTLLHVRAHIAGV
ncbi:hypothetical protein BD311DRAFT_804778 [Dichomitus squalens]|uniref:Uncharacterized protein n=1 Tax=Dichomitus squalens TaxID=114155 RepID=A0A4V2K140_9APHY|nr:hypothetical protein BD311DRAFT_804778 [Dichomitus squalens]